MTPDESVEASADLKVSLTELAGARRSLSVEVPAEQVAHEYDKSCRQYMRSLRVPGFRQGKVPLHIIRQRFGREIEQETAEHVIEHALEKAVADAGVKPLRAPVLKEYKYTHGEALTFTAEFEVMPPVTVRGAGEIRVAMSEPAVTDRMIADALDAMRERAARFDPVEGRGIHQGDHAVVDIRVTFAAGQGEDIARENVMLEVGSGGPHPELTEHLRDMKPGDQKSFEVSYPEDHPARELAGRRVSYAITVREIKEKRLPELDDEFAKDVGSFESLEELRRRVADDLMARERYRAREEARSSALQQLLERNPDAPVPDVLVDEEVDRRLDELARTMSLQGIDPRRASVDWDEIREKQRDPAARAVRATILLDAIAVEQKISVGPEAMDAAVAQEAARRRQTPEAFRAKLAKDGRLERLRDQLLREKVLDFLLATSNT
jgi:trigger factor